MTEKSSALAAKKDAFSLIETLVALAVFILLVFLVFQVVTQTAQSTGQGNRRMEATRSARTSLDTLAEDLVAIVSSNGATLVTGVDSEGNTTLAFLCAARPDGGSAGKSRMGSVFFGIQNRSENGAAGGQIPMLCRGFSSVPWANNLQNGLAAIFNASVTPSNTVFEDTLGNLIFRMEAVYVKNDGSIVYSPPQMSGFNSVPPLAPQAVPVDLNEIKALIVGVAVLDKKTQKLLLDSNAQGVGNLGASLPRVIQNGKTPMEVWSGVDFSAFPLPVRQNIRFFQRTIYLP